MATKVILPQLGESIHEGTIGKWLKKVGDSVEEFESLVEIITDKVNAEVPSPIKGTLSQILVQEGETVEVGVVIAEMTELGAKTEQSAQTEQMKAAFAPPQTPIATELNRTANHAVKEEVEASFPNGKASGGWYEDEAVEVVAVATPVTTTTEKTKQRYSPAVRRLAQENQLNLEQLSLRGSGLGGRITRDDIQMYLAAKPSQAAVVPMHDQLAANAMRQMPLATPSPLAPLVPPVVSNGNGSKSAEKPVAANSSYSEAFVSTGNEQVVALTPMRRAIAEHMLRSVQTSPHAWTMVEVDLSRLVRYRTSAKAQFKEREGVELTYLPFVIKAVIDGLREFPMLNSAWSNDGIVVKHDLNIGIAIDVPDGLVVPVVKNADDKSLVGLTRSVNDLVARARSKKLMMADVQGGTFTVNNPGSFGSVMSQPIINQPQAAIVTMEAIVKRPVVVTDSEGTDSIVVRSMMNMCISFDHRIVDGAMAGRFLQFVKRWLEQRDFNTSF